MVEHQYTFSTRRVVDTQFEQELLEDILEESKPPYAPGTEHLDYLLKTPFRYPPSPYSSRFRRAHEGVGVFYCAEAIRTALAEFSHWRRHFFMASPGTPLPRHEESLTIFNVAYQAQLQLDLTSPPLLVDRIRWTDPADYSFTQALADAARAGGIDVIRYESVRDPERGPNLALLRPQVFAHPAPLSQQTWYLYLGLTETNCTRSTGRGETFTFAA